MKKSRRRIINIRFLLTLLLNLCLIIAVVLLMRHAQVLLNSDAKVNLMEIVTQNRDVIASKLMLEVNNLENFASEISSAIQEEEVTSERLKNVILSQVSVNEKEAYFVADREGTAYFSDGTEMEITGRKYFKLAMSGVQNISDKVISRVDGEEKFMISVPLYHNDEIQGTVQKAFTHDEMYELCSVSLFSAQGYMYIINSEGYILMHTVHDNCTQQSDNYFRDLYGQDNKKQSEKLQQDIKNNKEGFMATKVGGTESFSAYAPIKEIHDWYLISTVPTKAVAGNGSTVINLFYIILLSVVIIFCVSIFYFMYYKNKQKEQVERIAFVDPITGGHTYGKFVVAVEKALLDHPNGSFAILKFDMDNFRFVNSYYGFAFGDRLLQQLYLNVQRQLHNHEIVARITGDNFVVFLEHFDDMRIKEILDCLYSEEFTIYISAGLYVIKDAEESVGLMLDKASTAARSVKGVANRRLEYYSEVFDVTAVRNEQLKRAVSQAIENREFIPFYQPKVDIDTGEVVGGEALARWRTADNKLISPGEFIPMAEKTGTIVEIDLLIFEQVLRYLSSRIKQEKPCVPISVNFSRVHLLNDDFLEKLERLTAHYGVLPELVEIELTESAIFDNRGIILEFTNKLQSMGFRVDMDDFGSGYSSLNMLKDIPIDILKIDREFLLESVQPQKREIIFSSVVEMAKKLGIEVIVEGVEYVENVELMRRCGCKIAQGYYFAKPMEEEQFTEFAWRK